MRTLIRFLAFLQGFRGTALLGIPPSRIRAFRESAKHDRPANSGVRPDSARSDSVWFHASSLGELEMLRPLIDDFVERGVRVGVSVFSESALPGLRDLSGRVWFAGLSPREDVWDDWFESCSVRKLILAKYDFWPGMLMAASARDLPVMVVNAEWRSSLRWVLLLFCLLRAKLPRFRFLVNPGEEQSQGELRRRFGFESVAEGVNPRFERIRRRIRDSVSSEKEARIARWREAISVLPRPVTLVGSGWLPDVLALAPEIRKGMGSLVVVPHSLSPETIEPLGRFLRENLPDRSLLIPEMGILVELYPAADRAFVGGGFGKGVHSTLEPALQGIPVGCGPARVHQFPEVRELERLGILTVCRDREAVASWVRRTVSRASPPWDPEKPLPDYQRLLDQCLQFR